eukprot:16441766-Heterocapsa_arctica.AAC.1
MYGASAERLPKPNMYTSLLLCGVDALAPRALIRNYRSNIRVREAIRAQLMHTSRMLRGKDTLALCARLAC